MHDVEGQARSAVAIEEGWERRRSGRIADGEQADKVSRVDSGAETEVGAVGRRGERRGGREGGRQCEYMI